MRDHVATIKGRPGISLAQLLEEWIPTTMRQPGGWFERRLRHGDCVVLLDGLDEIAQASDRRDIADWIEEQAKIYQRNDYVITSRPQGYQTATIVSASVLQVRSFTDKQVGSYSA
jgi:predicted NACHT family NTPase